MATDILPHNLIEIANACIYLLENSQATVKDLCKIVLGPDFPTNAEIITPKSEIFKIYQTGLGSIKMRAVYTEEQGEIIINALPHMVSGAKVLEQIAGQMHNKKLPQVVDLRDESDHEEPTRLIIVPRSNRVDADEIMAHLFATTDLERSYRVNFNIIGLDGKPRVKNLLEILQEWLQYRQATVKQRLQYRLEKVITRLHILDGFLIAYLNVEEIIKIIRTADDPKASLIKKFKLSTKQAEAILDLKLRHLAKLEEIKIKAEQKDLAEERENLQLTLNSTKRLKTLIKKELKEDIKTHGDHRLSPIVAREEAKALVATISVPVDPVTVILSSKGWVRAGKGHELDPEELSYKAGDEYKSHVLGKTNQAVVFFDSHGRAYTIMAHALPSARGYGEPLTGRVTPEPGAVFTDLLMADVDSQKILLITTAGYGFITQFSELLGKNKKGKAIVNLATGASLLNPIIMPAQADDLSIALCSSDGKMLVASIAEIPILSKGKGKKLFGITPNEFAEKDIKIVAATLFSKGQKLTVVTGRKKLELGGRELKKYQGQLGQRGSKLPKGCQKVKQLLV
jgi:topoisomerase IV subunit A